jgi:flagellar motor switch protein FliM
MTKTTIATGSGASAAPGDIVAYDYRGRSEFDPGTAEELAGLHKAFCRELTRHLSHLLQIGVEITARDIDEVPYSSYVRSLPSPTVLGVVALRPTAGQAVVDLPNHLGFAILDILLGGSGRPTAFRAMTDLEGTLITTALGAVAASVAAAFAPAAALDPELVAVQAHPSVAGMEEPDEPTLVMSFGVRLDSMQPTEGILSICYPRRALQALLTPASDEQIEIKVQAPVNPEVFEPLGDVPIEVRARLKASPISLRELADLQPGDVVVLNHKANQPVIISAGGSDMLEGHVGQYNKNVALSITRWTV